MAANITLNELLGLAGDFVVNQKGAWEHGDWEVLLAKLAETGLELDDEAKRNLGNILESARHFYPLMACPCEKKPATKKAARKPAAKKAEK